MTSFWWSLLAGAIILVVDLFVTYEIIVKVIEARDKRVWEPARRRLLSAVKRQCQAATIGWALSSDPARIKVEEATSLNAARLAGLVEDLKEEVGKLGGFDQSKLPDQQTERVWRTQLRALASLKDSLRLAIDRAQITLRDDPAIVEALADLEAAFMAVPGLDAEIRGLEAIWRSDDVTEGAQLMLRSRIRASSILVVAVLSGFVKLLDELRDIPGAYE